MNPIDAIAYNEDHQIDMRLVGNFHVWNIIAGSRNGHIGKELVLETFTEDDHVANWFEVRWYIAKDEYNVARRTRIAREAIETYNML